MTPQLNVVVHDVAGRTLPACDRLLRAIEDVAPVPLTLLAVPRYHHEPASPALARWINGRRAAGDEAALHGFTHLDEGEPASAVDRLRRRFYTRGEGEFWALDEADAASRLRKGIEWFESHGWPLHGFVAPAWLMGPGAWRALQASGRFRYTATLAHLHLLPEGRRLTSRGVVYSSSRAWRRAASVAWAAVNAAGLRRNPLLRLELHPHDADHAGVRRSWQRVLAQALAQGREPRTVAATARACAAAAGDPVTAA